MKKILTIDPGVNGGIAYHDYDGNVQVLSMPTGMTEIADTLRELVIYNQTQYIYLEKTGTYMPGNGGPGAVTFARHCGNLEAICYMLGLPTTQVAPNVWMKSLGTVPKDKAERKRWIKEEMSRRYPHLRVTFSVSDALGLMTYAIGKGERCNTLYV